RWQFVQFLYTMGATSLLKVGAAPADVWAPVRTVATTANMPRAAAATIDLFMCVLEELNGTGRHARGQAPTTIYVPRGQLVRSLLLAGARPLPAGAGAFATATRPLTAAGFPRNLAPFAPRFAQADRDRLL